VKLCGLPVVAGEFAVAEALAVSVHVPAPTYVTVFPDTVHTLLVLELTDSVGEPFPE
jgi:hypothetical protein